MKALTVRVERVRGRGTALRAKMKVCGRALGLAGLLAGLGCSGTAKEADKPDPSGDGSSTAPSAEEERNAAGEAPLELGPVTKGSFREHPAKVAWVFDDDPNAPRKMSIGQAEARGYTIVDLSNAWTPYIFSEKTPGLEDAQKNRYRNTYIGLANDKVNSFGDPIDDHEHNFLELYGIPPTLRVIWDEWQHVQTEVVPCLEQASFDPSVFTRYRGVIAYKDNGGNKRVRLAKALKSKLDKAVRKAKLDASTPEGMQAVAEHPKTKRLHQQWREVQDEVDVIVHAQKRFRCERMFNSKNGLGAFEAGVYDSETTHALANFEKKHDIMGWGHFKRDNLDMLAMGPDEIVHARLLRAVQERVVASAGIVEDGSAARWKKDFEWKDSKGQTQGLRDIVGEYTTTAVETLGIGDTAAAKDRLAALSDLGEGDFEQLLVAIKMPPLPEYYAEDMKFSTIIDRGDVWYDFPYDEAGNKLAQPRKRYPHLTLYVEHLGQKIPLVHWRTTIGSWRREVGDTGEIMLKYKDSDVGERVWKDIVAAPVWIPPANTPPEELVKGQWYKGKFRRGVNYDEIGPGYRSAYGLVAAYHIKQITDAEGNVTSEFDNSIRTHGSVDYMSILRRFSHGCHRLYNMDAVRLFSFVLRHRNYVRHGQQPVGVGRELIVEKANEDGTVTQESFNMRIDTRGYKYELVEPIPVLVTKGRIKGRRKSPINEYVPIPVPVEENEIMVDDGQGGTMTLPIPLPPMPLAPVQ